MVSGIGNATLSPWISEWQSIIKNLGLSYGVPEKARPHHKDSWMLDLSRHQSVLCSLFIPNHRHDRVCIYIYGMPLPTYKLFVLAILASTSYTSHSTRTTSSLCLSKSSEKFTMPSISKIALATATFILPTTAIDGSGHSTRYWDCCKPSCAWSGKAPVNSPVGTCTFGDGPLGSPDNKSGCDGGDAFTCSSNAPWAVNDNLAYGFAATAINGGNESTWCCACYA